MHSFRSIKMIVTMLFPKVSKISVHISTLCNKISTSLSKNNIAHSTAVVCVIR